MFGNYHIKHEYIKKKKRLLLVYCPSLYLSMGNAFGKCSNSQLGIGKLKMEGLFFGRVSETGISS